MEKLRIPKDKINVTLHFGKEVKLDGAFFLPPVAVEAPGYIRLSAFLESNKKFIPFMLNGAEKPELINKSLVQAVEWVYPETGWDQINTDLLQTAKVALTFADDTGLEGLLISEVPRERARLSDCVNIQHRFLRVTTETSYLHINKYMLKKVVCIG